MANTVKIAAVEMNDRAFLYKASILLINVLTAFNRGYDSSRIYEDATV